jgi:hypothetical protein
VPSPPRLLTSRGRPTNGISARYATATEPAAADATATQPAAANAAVT